ncbi:hypothetical protein [Rhodopirellula baltica]|uniref:hypothetical protein n=1 Tax=Rhodopirellula baltica TaxID=265606 RepID=UPI0013E8A8A3|nr:hypothetical protein [Rhodopirellula baltica]
MAIQIVYPELAGHRVLAIQRNAKAKDVVAQYWVASGARNLNWGIILDILMHPLPQADEQEFSLKLQGRLASRHFQTVRYISDTTERLGIKSEDFESNLPCNEGRYCEG